MYVLVLPDTPAPLVGPLHYSLPAELGPVPVGSRVLVPLAGRTVPGFVVGFDREAPVRQVLPVRGVLSRTPLFGDEAWQLACWVADRYLAHPRDALRAAFPSEALSRVVRHVRLVREPEGRLGADPATASLLDRLRSGPVPEPELVASPELRRALARLRRAGCVEQELAALPPAVRPARESVVRLAIPPERAWDLVGLWRRRAPRRAAALERLLRSVEVPKAELSRAVGSGTVRGLVEAGVATEQVVEVVRDPLREAFREGGPVQEPTREQLAACQAVQQALRAGQHRVFLLHGVTGSGKTEVYLRCAAEAVAGGGQVLVLVPEIVLAPQTVARFLGRFGDRVAVLHSQLTAGERFDTWRRLHAGQFDVVVGTRSAAFAPLSRLRLVVVDEEHETAYKQPQSPRYHAREVAVERARRSGAPVILGSATPAVESLWRARCGVWEYLRLGRRVLDRPLPEVQVVDMRAQGGRSVFSRPLVEALRAHLDRGDQVLLYVNRRGYAACLVCRECGFVPRCHRCAVSLTFHLANRTLRCHYCGRVLPAPSTCPSCGGVGLRPYGPGTQRVEEAIRSLFPGVAVARADRDTLSGRGAHARLVERLRRKEVRVLVGTQVVAKGLDLPEVGLVGVVAADVALSLPDFRAGERTLQQLVQVAGRAGRGDRPGRVVVQTYQPEHPAIRAAAEHDVLGFYQGEWEDRRRTGYPPFASLVHVVFSARNEARAAEASRSVAERVRGAEVLGPSPAPLNPLRGWFRWRLVVRAADDRVAREAVREALASWRRPGDVRVAVDVDPLEML
ncbi:MAG: primosomal protein N' [Armatimonadota bacterium]|nr:primosomal protein N' [Armatimonadota bacterium]MDR7389199.1 primosomal protein N' [Armatimonadota bacterium]MDR7406457.1 primosomal protein N' [Armatimonadota bacterium]MDR7407706.1 primosomal protein N' [Armatimonadota bacterium]MDR7411162.1 primosomal protein N' [Armatimonadota bacterium]